MPKFLLCALLISAVSSLSAAEPVDFTVKLETVMKHDDGKFLWFHPRAAPVPGGVVMTIQKHLKVSDYYSGLHFMRRDGVDGAWSGPTLPPEIDWQPQTDGVTLSVADVTPGWHEKTGKLIAIGCRVRYSPKANVPGNNVVVFQIDPATGAITLKGDPVEVPMASCIRWME
ncbi:MAG: hypothetical protein IAE77_09085 [Prosthecobacter sp.]|jgi:hypothetical protein|uniref:hypothetical protein n=1 Tax=Prosthecobacter sp. TaxID=1965333 RepID=UPI001A011D7A|nr:hypothetical protein [Prosthecobacter sp.]MBE2283595.1 hypothetical protein [Prosthecobacter sp.]